MGTNAATKEYQELVADAKEERHGERDASEEERSGRRAAGARADDGMVRGAERARAVPLPALLLIAAHLLWAHEQNTQALHGQSQGQKVPA